MLRAKVDASKKFLLDHPMVNRCKIMFFPNDCNKLIAICCVPSFHCYAKQIEYKNGVSPTVWVPSSATTTGCKQKKVVNSKHSCLECVVYEAIYNKNQNK